MTPAQFDALTTLRGLGDSATNRALRMVLVDGLSQSDAAQRCGIGRSAVSNASKAAARAVDLARVVVAEN